jgi:uncharacterized protein (TIGR02118 family)
VIKIIALLKRRPGLTPEEFSDYWFNRHWTLAQKLVPEEALSVRYVQHHAITLGGERESPYDAVAELCFTDRAGLQRWLDWYFSDAGQPLRDDEEHFMDKSRRVVLITDERVMRDVRG